MASLTNACRLSARLALSKLPQEPASVRTFRTSSASLAAQIFTMPALSPTMTEGNIAAWRVKEGDKFVAGDVLLEIETDKATMDVEAQDDGIIFKILAAEGTKGVPVGARIGVLAEEGDDLAALEVPADDAPKQAAPAASKKEKEAMHEKTGSIPAEERTASGDKAQIPARRTEGKASKQTYPLYPSIVQLLHENGVDISKADEIPATGPKGRLLKGDVLVYLGKAKADAAAKGQAIYERLSHLDLSNIKIAEKKVVPESEKRGKAAAKAAEASLQCAVSISFDQVLAAQKQVKNSLDVDVPMSEFLARAMEAANKELPLPENYTPSVDELFNQVLGLDKFAHPKKTSRGRYVAQIDIRRPATPFSYGKPDVIDLLTGSVKQPAKQLLNRHSGAVLRLQVPKAEEDRAMAFLSKTKSALENEPARLVL